MKYQAEGQQTQMYSVSVAVKRSTTNKSVIYVEVRGHPVGTALADAELLELLWDFHSGRRHVKRPHVSRSIAPVPASDPPATQRFGCIERQQLGW